VVFFSCCKDLGVITILKCGTDSEIVISDIVIKTIASGRIKTNLMSKIDLCINSCSVK